MKNFNKMKIVDNLAHYFNQKNRNELYLHRQQNHLFLPWYIRIYTAGSKASLSDFKLSDICHVKI